MSMGKLARKQILKWLMQKVKFFMCLKYFYKIDKYGFVCKKKKLLDPADARRALLRV